MNTTLPAKPLAAVVTVIEVDALRATVAVAALKVVVTEPSVKPIVAV